MIFLTEKLTDLLTSMVYYQLMFENVFELEENTVKCLYIFRNDKYINDFKENSEIFSSFFCQSE